MMAIAMNLDAGYPADEISRAASLAGEYHTLTAGEVRVELKLLCRSIRTRLFGAMPSGMDETRVSPRLFKLYSKGRERILCRLFVLENSPPSGKKLVTDLKRLGNELKIVDRLSRGVGIGAARAAG
ncbi:MAG: hypothetical protein KC777_09155 [Cyanobacteria bacterium HKST-UBA02]|nr:hypothetical protein [Cyanobacteria bacterium HKST-UBA02]